jgi:steroid delta-isomerase-like uncharacterized protein
MDSQSLKDMTRRWIVGVFDERNFGLIAEMNSEDCVFHLNGMEPFGAETLRSVHSSFVTAFPDLHNTIEKQVAEGNVVATRGTTHGTHQGPLGKIAATGKSVSVPWMIFTRFDGGRIVENHEIYDEAALMKQLGVAPESD